MSFKCYMKNGKDDVIVKKGAPNGKHIKGAKTMELPKIDQGPKEHMDLLHLLKNMKWKNHELNRPEFPSTNKAENSEPKKVTRQIISHDLIGKKNHTAFVKAPLLRNRVINRKIPEPKPSVEKPKIIAPKVQINRPTPSQSPSQKFTKPQNNAAMTKAQLEFSKRNSKNLLSLNTSAKINGPNASKMQPQNQELIDTQNEIAKVQAELEFLTNNPDYIPETDLNDENPKISELNPALQSENQELSNTLTEIAKVQAELEFLKNNPDYIPEANECIPKAPKNNELITQKQKVLKSNVSLNKDKQNPKKAVTNSSKVPLKGKQATKDLPNKQSNVPKLNSKSEIGFPLADEYKEFDSNPKTLKDIQKLREAETKVAETKTKLALMKNYTQILLQKEYKEEANALTEQPDTQKIAEAKNNIAETKSQLKILEDSQEESFEDYRQRMQKCNRRRKPNTLDTIIEEESEILEDGCEEQEDITEAEESIEEKANEEKLEVADDETCETLNEEECETLNEEECETLNEEECETLGEEEREEIDVECEEADGEEREKTDGEECEEADKETPDVSEEEREDSENTELCTTVSENENESELENNNPQKFDTKIPAKQKRQLLDILKNINWGKTEKLNESVVLQEVQLTESTDTEEVVESSEIQSDSMKKHDIKFDDLEIQPFGTKEADSVSPKASKEDIFTSFFKTQSSYEEEMVSESEKSLLKFRMLQEELLESSSIATPKIEEVHTKSSSKNEPEKSHTSEDGSFSSFFEDKPLIKPKHEMQNNPREPLSDQSKSLGETKKEPKKSVRVETTLKDLPNTKESNLEQTNGDESILEGLKTMEIDQKTVELLTHKIINVAPCETASEIVIRPMELEYSEDFESDSSDKPTNTKVRDFTSDSCTEKEESLKIESVHMSEDCSKGSKQSFICHLYKVKIRIKSISWRGSGNMEAVTLSFYNPFTKENAAVRRKFVLPYFYTADFYCYVSYISPPNMLDSSLACYPPVILISKRKSVVELARGVLNLNKEQTNVPLKSNGKIMGDIILSVKILDYGPLGDKDDSSNEIIEIVFKETKNKEIKIASPSDFVDKTLQKKKKHLIVEELSSSGDNISSDLPPDQLFKKRPFRYKRKTKSKRRERFRRYTSEASFLAISSISIQNDQIEKQKSFLNNCKDIQTDVQEEDFHRRKSKSKMIQTESEMDSKHTTTRLQCESKVTQTEATSERQQIISNGKNKLSKKYEMVVTNGKLTQSSIRDGREENWKTESETVEKPKKVKKVSSEPLQHRKLKQVRAEKIFSESEEIKSVQLEQNKSSQPKKSKTVKLKAFDLAEECTAGETAEAVHQYLQGKKLAERFFKVCTERKPSHFDKMTYEEQKLYKCNYVKQLRDALPSDFVTPPSIMTKEKDSSERRWMSHMAAFLHNKKAMSSDGSSTSVDKTDDQVPEIHSEVASPDVLINNPDYQAMKKYYHPELCKANVMTSTSYPYVRPSTTECGVQTSKRVIKNFAAQTKQEKLPPLLSKKSKKLSNKTSELETCLVIVDNIPSAQNGVEKLINKNILYEKVCESKKVQDGKTKDVKKSSKTIRLSKSNVQLESYPGQCASEMSNKNSVKNLQFELQDFVKNIKLELHILKHRAQYTPDSNFQYRKNTSREITDFDRLVNSFTSLVARNDEHDFNAVYSELQQLQHLVYKFKKYSEEHLGETDIRSKTKQIKDVDNYVSQDKELKLIFKNPEMDQTPEKRSRDNNNYRQKPSRG